MNASGENGARPAVSAVIAAHNEERWIGACLESLTAQTHSELELLVVDDGSTDSTAEIASRAGAEVITRDQGGAAAARNTGAAQAAGEILAFIDADDIYDPHFIERLIEPFEDPDVDATFPGDVRFHNPEQGLARGWLRVRGFADGRAPNFGATNSIAKAVRGDRFREVGGYPEVGYGEDEYLGKLLGPSVVAQEAGWEVTLPTGPREILGKARWIGRGPRFAEGERPSLWRLSPFGSIPAALRLLLAERDLAATAVRLIYDAGLLVGYVEGRLRPGVRAHA